MSSRVTKTIVLLIATFVLFFLVFPFGYFTEHSIVRDRFVRDVTGANGPLRRAIDDYKRDTGSYPNRLMDLKEGPVGQAWKGPYVLYDAAFKDPWDYEYRYFAPGRHNKTGIDLWSIGPDGVDGTDDDIVNWETDK